MLNYNIMNIILSKIYLNIWRNNMNIVNETFKNLPLSFNDKDGLRIIVNRSSYGELLYLRYHTYPRDHYVLDTISNPYGPIMKIYGK